MKKSLVYVFTGDGKGKTSAAIGTAVRAVGAGIRVGWVAFYKQASWKLSELEPLKKLGVEVYLMGEGFHIKGPETRNQKPVKMRHVGLDGVVVDRASEAEHKAAAKRALVKARVLLGHVDVLVLDEVNNALKDELIELTELTKLIEKRKKTHLILTGRDALLEIIKLADLVTSMKKVKHPYDKGELAVRGLDF